MRVDLLTREYPPFVYGGAGVHVDELAKVLRPKVDLRVLAFDGPRDDTEPGVIGYPEVSELEGANAFRGLLGQTPLRGSAGDLRALP